MSTIADLPRPKCCAQAREPAKYTHEPKIYWWVEPEDENDRGWKMPNLSDYIGFCPWCGERLPVMQKKAVQSRKITKVTDGGYYCDTCRERLDSCTCTWPGVDWEPQPFTPSPIEIWRRNNWAELQTHAGKNVAIHPTRGIVASGTLKDVIQKVRELGLAQEVLVERVRNPWKPVSRKPQNEKGPVE